MKSEALRLTFLTSLLFQFRFGSSFHSALDPPEYFTNAAGIRAGTSTTHKPQNARPVTDCWRSSVEVYLMLDALLPMFVQ